MIPKEAHSRILGMDISRTAIMIRMIEKGFKIASINE
jgi:hypothetical protein